MGPMSYADIGAEIGAEIGPISLAIWVQSAAIYLLCIEWATAGLLE